jgi:hypothetical protein
MTFVQTPALALLPSTLATLARTAPDLNVEVSQRETAPALDELRSRSTWSSASNTTPSRRLATATSTAST